MPTYKVTDPNTGRTVRLTGDSPPSQQELEEIFSQFQVQDVTQQEQQAALEQEQQKIRQEMAADLNPIESFLVGAGRGFTTIGRALGLADAETEEEKKAFEALQKESPISTTIGEITGETAPFILPGLAAGRAATLGGRVLGSGAVGAAEAGLITRGKGGDDVEQLKAAGLGGTIAGGLEVAFPVIGRIGGKIFRNVTGRQPTGPLLTPDGAPTQEFREALDKAGLTFDDVAAETQRLLQTGDVEDATQVSRRIFLEEQGLTPTRAQVTGDVTDFQAQQELAKQSGRVRSLLEAQEGVLASRFDNAVVETGGSANPSSSVVFDTIADRAIDQDKAISDAYKLATQQVGTDKVVKPSKLISEIKAVAASDRATGGLPSAVRDILKNRGVLGKKGLKIEGRVDPKVAEEIRQDMNALYDSLSPFGREKLRDFKNALDLDVQRAVGKDTFAEARSMKAQFEKDLRRAKVNKFDRRKGNLVRDILDNKINPDRFLQDAVITNRVRSTDLEQLKRYLNQSDEGVDAWNSLRAEAMQFIKTNSMKEVSGEPALTRASLDSALDKFGRDKLRVLFSQEERKFLQDMQKVAKIREPKRGTALGKGPSAQAIKELEKAVNRNSLINAVWAGGAELISERASLQQVKPPTERIIKPSPATPLIAPAAVAATQQEQ